MDRREVVAKDRCRLASPVEGFLELRVSLGKGIAFEIGSAEQDGSTFTIVFQSVTNRIYELQRGNLTDAEGWQTIDSAVGMGTTQSLTDTNAATGFYRLMVRMGEY